MRSTCAQHNNVILPLFSAGYLLLAGATLANAQCYQFSGSGATLQVNITSFNLVNPPVTVLGDSVASYFFSSQNSLTIGQSTQTSTSIFDGAISIEYLASVGGSQAVTSFQIVVPNGAPATPGSGNQDWQAQLFGAGNLLPNGIVPVLPPISAWYAPPPGIAGAGDFIEVDSGASKTKYPITSVSSCSAAGGIDLNKALGLTCATPGCVMRYLRRTD